MIMLLTLANVSLLYRVYVSLLRGLVTLAVAASLLVSADRVLKVVRHALILLQARWSGRKPEQRFSSRPLPDPVLDDSTCKATRMLVEETVAEWRERGVNVQCVCRDNRKGYKAGALKEGMELLDDCEFIAIFDADFKPEPDFLMRTLPYLVDNPQVGFVQARWSFTNADESFLTKAQQISLNFHCKCEQYVHFATGSFFNFNGTAGVWRAKAIRAAGGWNSRTTVEDMDLSLRAFMAGWAAVFLTDVTVLNELPASFFAYRKQQHRWTCGPVQLWRRTAPDIWRSALPLATKLDLLLVHFGVTIPLWALVHLPVVITLSTAFFTPQGWVHCILYVLFENAMGVVKLWAVVAGLLDLRQAQEWVMPLAPRVCRFYAGEMLMGLLAISAAAAALASATRWSFAVFLALQGLVFGAFAFNLVDCGGLLGGRLGERAR
ncbi:hypothetical protein WJX81_004395 [Elliptochloris bilobata]|uniref:glucomannan 4-beta-mannosyltransferase n=1 Tax=Elliptochloris bilobata TaxID=381761 RepID=A0AAW1RUA2_9CHLO